MIINKQGQEFIIKDTHRGLWYEDGKLTKVLEAGRYEIPVQKQWFKRLPTVECVLVDVASGTTRSRVRRSSLPTRWLCG